MNNHDERQKMIEQESFGKGIIQAFVNSVIENKGKSNVLHIRASTFNLFDDLAGTNVLQVARIEEIPDNIQFDIILGDLPLGTYQSSWEDVTSRKTVKAQQNWLEMLKSLLVLKDQGLAIFLVEPHGLSNTQGQKFQRELNERGFFVNGIFNTPERVLSPDTVIRPVLVSISKEEHQNLYLAELLESDQSEQVAHNFLASVDTENLLGGTMMRREDFVGFHSLKIQRQIERLETQYKEYDKHSLGELAVEINLVRSGGKYQERENSVYIPRIGKSQVVSRLQDAKLKHHNYFQVVLKEIALNEYIVSFFESTLGRLILDSLSMQSVIPHVNKRDIEQVLVAVPSVEEQESIVLTQRKLLELKDVIDNFKKELALNPTSSTSIQGQLSRMLEAIVILTDADKVRGIIREGESKRVEFKESLSLDVKKQTKESYIELSALKTIVAFLNTDGGVLLIGVADDGRMIGVDAEIEKFHKNTDKFLLHFKNLLQNKIGEAFYPFIEYRLVRFDSQRLLFVECEASKTPCYLDNKEFYVRTNPATDKLEGPKLVEYVKHHFGN